MQYNSPMPERGFASLLPLMSLNVNHDRCMPPFQVDHLPPKTHLYGKFTIQEMREQAMS